MSKKYDNLFNEIVSYENLYNAYRKVRRGKNKYNIDAMEFARNETANLLQLQDDLIKKKYRCKPYSKFYVYEPKERLIYAPCFRDKIVQIATNNILKQIYNKTYIYDSYGSIDNKGTHKCIDRISYFMRKAKWEYGDDSYIVKLDVKKFFYTIDREILKKIYRRKISCYSTLWLLDTVIDSADQIDELGLPLGNTLSQLSANVYMNEFDQYAKRVLRIKYYVRYMDDMIIMVENKEKAKEIVAKSSKFLNQHLNLKLNTKKSTIFPISQGVNSIGFKIHSTHRLLRNDSKKKIKRKCKAFPNIINNKNVSILKAEQILNSWYGHASHGNSYNFICSLVDKHDYLVYEYNKIRIERWLL